MGRIIPLASHFIEVKKINDGVHGYGGNIYGYTSAERQYPTDSKGSRPQ